MNANPGTDAEAAYDVWLSGTYGPDEIMIWIDNANRGTGGATQIGTGTFGGQNWKLLQYGGGELIWSLNSNAQSGAVRHPRHAAGPAIPAPGVLRRRDRADRLRL